MRLLSRSANCETGQGPDSSDVAGSLEQLRQGFDHRQSRHCVLG